MALKRINKVKMSARESGSCGKKVEWSMDSESDGKKWKIWENVPWTGGRLGKVSRPGPRTSWTENRVLWKTTMTTTITGEKSCGVVEIDLGWICSGRGAAILASGPGRCEDPGTVRSTALYAQQAPDR